MKTIINFLLGILLGIFAISLGISAIKALFHLALLSALIYGVITYGIGLLAVKFIKEA